MRELKTKILTLDNAFEERYKLYLNLLVEVVVGYLLQKNYKIKYVTNAVVFLEDVIISLNQGFGFSGYKIEPLEYY